VDIHLTPIEARVIGCLLEKHRTTPEHYPLSLNALTNACNQKSSREPGKRDARFAHLFGSEIEMSEAAAPVYEVSAKSGTDSDRMEQLEQMVNQLRDEMANLKARIDRVSPEIL